LTAFAGASMTYDLDGYLVSKGAYTYAWDSFGQLTSVSQSGTVVATFAYDGFGRRITKTSSAGTVQYVWDGDQLVLEADASGTTTQAYSYYPGIDRPHSVSAGGQTYYTSIEPATGDVNGLIRASDNAVVAQYAYTPWGAFDAPDQALINGVRVNSLRWKGLIHDTETGLYYMRARYYDPQLRRFIAEDPIGLAGGINLYAFASGDPVNGNDPHGLDPQYLPGVTVWGTGTGYTGCWKWLDTWGENGAPTKAWGQEQCGGGANGPAIMDGWGQPQSTVGPRGQNTGSGVSAQGSKGITAKCGRALAGLAFNGAIDALTWGQGGIVKAVAKGDMVKVLGILGENAMTATRGLPVKNIAGTRISTNTNAVVARPMAAWMFTGAQTGVGSAITGSLPKLAEVAVGALVPFGGTFLAGVQAFNSCF
jgi:RHS repeat-associated protein